MAQSPPHDPDRRFSPGSVAAIVAVVGAIVFAVLGYGVTRHMHETAATEGGSTRPFDPGYWSDNRAPPTEQTTGATKLPDDQKQQNPLSGETNVPPARPSR